MENEKRNELVSIILPVHNAEKSVGKALESLIAQTYKNIEILAIDDGSTDKSPEILEQYAAKDKRVKVMTRTSPDPAGARDAGLDEAAGEYIMFCGDTGWFDPDMVERMADKMDGCGVDLALCLVRPYNLLPRAAALYGINRQEALPSDGRVRGIWDIWNNASFALWDKIFRKSMIEVCDISFSSELEGAAAGRSRDYAEALFLYRYLLASQSFYPIREKLYNHFFREKDPAEKQASRWENLLLCEDLGRFCRWNGRGSRNIHALGEIANLRLHAMKNLFSPKELGAVVRRMNHIIRDIPFVFAMHGSEPILMPVRNLWRGKGLWRLRMKAALAAWSRKRLRNPEPIGKLASRMDRAKDGSRK